MCQDGEWGEDIYDILGPKLYNFKGSLSRQGIGWDWASDEYKITFDGRQLGKILKQALMSS